MKHDQSADGLKIIKTIGDFFNLKKIPQVKKTAH